jgi:LEA14-like dessication related protein
VLAFAVLAFGGCTYLKEAIGLGPQSPKVQVEAIDVVRATIGSLDLLVTLRVDNPNDFQLSFSKLRYDMVAAGLRVAAGTFDEHLVIPASGHAEIKLPLTVDAGAALQLVHDLLTKSEDTEAIMTATAAFDTPLGAMDVSFEDKRPLKKIAGF